LFHPGKKQGARRLSKSASVQIHAKAKAMQILFGGSRNLPSSLAPVVGQWVNAAQYKGHSIVTGCATGADAQTITAALNMGTTHTLHVFAAFTPSGAGSCTASNVHGVHNAAWLGASVQYLAGGPLAVPLPARLIQRSQAAVRTAAACVFFCPGIGSLAVAAYAIGRGLPVYAVQEETPAAPRGCVGAWVPASFLGLSCWKWSPAQTTLF
jgi:hypothetical protein